MKKNNFSAVICESQEDLLGLTQKWKEQGNSLVFTNGCFDILHAGHVDYLQKAAAEGDRLIVGLNNDDSVTNLKGKDRPYNSENKRIIVLAALRCVDAIVVFEEETPLRLISAIIPDVLVKGGDYRGKEVVGTKVVEENGGKLVLIDFVHQLSTTILLEKMKNTKS